MIDTIVYGIQLAIVGLVCSILLLPKVIRFLIRLHPKVLQLDFNTSLTHIDRFVLHYRYRKHILMQLTINRVVLSKIPNKWRWHLTMTDLVIRYLPIQPIRIGFQEEEQLYLERLHQKLIAFTPQRIERRRNKRLNIMGLLIESSIAKCVFIWLSRMSMQINEIVIQLPKLNSKEHDLPDMHFVLVNNTVEFHLNQFGELQWKYDNDIVFLIENPKIRENPIITIEGVAVNAVTKLGLTLDWLEDQSDIKVQLNKVKWNVNKEYHYSMDVLANEFFARPDINRTLKKYFNDNGFKYLGKPKNMNISIDEFVIEFEVFQDFVPMLHKYAKNALVFRYEKMKYHCELSYKDDLIGKNIEMSCGMFSVSTMQSDIIRFDDVHVKSTGVVSYSVHAVDKIHYIIQYGQVSISVCPNTIKYFMLMQTDVGRSFRYNFLENQKQRIYFKKYNVIAKQMCCELIGIALDSTNETTYDVKVTDKVLIQVVDGQVVNAIEFHQVGMVMGESTTTVTIDQCSVESELFGQCGRIHNMRIQSDQTYQSVVVSSCDIRVNYQNVEKYIKLAKSIDKFREFLNKYTNTSAITRRLEPSTPKQLQLITGQLQWAFTCKQQQCLSISIKQISTTQLDLLIFEQFRLLFSDTQNTSELMNINTGSLRLGESTQLDIDHLAIEMPETLKNIRGFQQTISQIQDTYRELKIFEQQEPTREYHKRRASHDGVLTIDDTANELPTKVKSILAQAIQLNIEKFDIKVHDTRMNAFIGKYRRFMHYNNGNNNINDNNRIQYLRVAEVFPLLHLNATTIRISLIPLLMPLETVLDKITKLDSHPTWLDGSFFDVLELFQATLHVEQVNIKLRDYLKELIRITDISQKYTIISSKLNAHNVALAMRLFYDVDYTIGTIVATGGLSLIFALRELMNRMNSILGPEDGRRPQFELHNELPFWDRLRLQFHGRIRLMIEQVLLKMTTDILPYSVDAITLSVKQIIGDYMNGTIKLQADKVKVGRVPKISRVLFIPRLQIVTELNWFSNKDQYDHYFLMKKPYFNQINHSLMDFISKRLFIESKFDCISYENNQMNFKDAKKNCLFVHYQNQFMRWLKNRPILRRDVLRMFSVKLSGGITQQTYNCPPKPLQHLVQYANYQTLLKFTYSKIMESLMIKQSLYQHTEVADIKIYANKFRFLFSNSEKNVWHSESYLKNKDTPMIGIQTLFHSLKCNIQLEPNYVNGEWQYELKSLSGGCVQLYASVYDGKHLLDMDTQQDANQQHEFVKFFDIQSVDYYSEYQSETLRDFSFTTRQFQEAKQIKMFSRKNVCCNTQATPQYHLFDILSEETILDNSFQGMRSRASEMTQNKEHEFNAFDIFLSARYLSYEQNKKIVLESSDETKTRETRLIKHFISTKNSQLLFTFYLQDILTNVFESIDLGEAPIEQKFQQAKQAASQKPKCYTREELLLMVSLVNPEFNLQYHNSNQQMILTSPSDCQFIISEFILPFDKFEIDKKRVTKLIFNGLDCYLLDEIMDPKKNVRFLPQHYTKVLRCDCSVFQMQSYSMWQNPIDFSEIIQTQDDSYNPFTWNQEIRREVAQVKVGQLSGTYAKQQLNGFIEMISFIELAVVSKKDFENIERFYRNKLRELNQFGAKTIEAQLKKKLNENNEKYDKEKSKIDYQISQASLALLDENDVQFVQFNISNVRVIETIYENLSRKSEIVLQDVEVINNMPLQDQPEYKQVLSQDPKLKKQSPFFRMVKKYYPLQIYQQKWFVIDQHDMKLNPLIIRLTEELYDKFYEYFFGEDTQPQMKRTSSVVEKKEKMKTVTDDYSKKIPNYYESLQVGELKVNASFKSQSVIKRMKDVTVVIEPYKSSKTFSTTKEQFDEFATFIIKQITVQIFSILGQKLFGSSNDNK